MKRHAAAQNVTTAFNYCYGEHENKWKYVRGVLKSQPERIHQLTLDSGKFFLLNRTANSLFNFTFTKKSHKKMWKRPKKINEYELKLKTFDDLLPFTLDISPLSRMCEKIHIFFIIKNKNSFTSAHSPRIWNMNDLYHKFKFINNSFIL